MATLDGGETRMSRSKASPCVSSIMMR
jgi:hypothetical protein